MPGWWPFQPGTSRVSVRAVPVSSLVSLTVATSQGLPGKSVSLVALLAPGVAVVVVAELLPEAALVFPAEVKTGDPLGRLPEVEVGHQQAGRAAVLFRKRPAVVLVGDPGLAVAEVGQRQVGR